jgi:hypothetical protein
MNKDRDLYHHGKIAVAALMRIRQRGTYRVIRDPEGVISLWAIEGTERGPFALSFADQGHMAGNIEAMSPGFVRAFVDYVSKQR